MNSQQVMKSWRCPSCPKEGGISWLKQHAKRQHKILLPELYSILFEVDPHCECGTLKQFVSFEHGFESYCKTCMSKKSLPSKRGSLISASLIGYKHTEETKKKMSSIAKMRDPSTRKGRISWSKGLTKETNESLLRSGKKTSASLKIRYSNSQTQHWIVGRNKDNDERVKRISQSLRKNFQNGLKQWNKGLTKFSDARVASMADKCKFNIEEVKSIFSSFSFEILDFSYEKNTIPIKVKCLRCNNEQLRSVVSIKSSSGRCSHCDPVCSAWHLEIFNYVKSIDTQAVANDRSVISPLELDILSAKHKFAIECNGLYWHSERISKNPWSHQFKVDLCLQKGIKLFHIFEDEWRNKKEIIQSIIFSKMGLLKRVGARKLTVKIAPKAHSSKFFQENHLDGNVPSSVTFGLYDGESLISALSLRVPHHKKWKDYLEVARFATLKGHSVAGGLSRLTKAAINSSFLNGKRGLISYLDCRLGGDGSSYQKSGWTIISSTSPRFWWTDNSVRYDRFKYRAMNGVPEKEIAAQAGVSRIYGCKNILMKYDILKEVR